jgi:hypothetical protein
VEIVLAEEDALESALRSLLHDEAAPTRPSTVALKSPPPPPPPSARRRRGLGAAVLVALVPGLVLLARGWLGRPSVELGPAPGRSVPSADPAGSPSPSPSAPGLVGELTAGLRGIVGEPGHLAIDFEHPLKSGRLRVWVDEDMVLEEKLSARVEKKALGFTYAKGGLAQTLDVSPGHHKIRAQVTWEDNDKTESIAGAFKAGATRRLEVRLGRIRKNLTLDWE